MSPRPADPAVRMALLRAAARIVTAEGRAALTLRRLASDVGTSTMAVYTHFGSMEDLRRELRREGFRRLGEHLAAVEETRDPVSDLGLLGYAYYVSATSEPNLYHVMFSEGALVPNEAGIGYDTFLRLVSGVERCMAAGRFAKGDALAEATELWALSHGIVSLQLAGFLTPADALNRLRSAALKLMLGNGDGPRSAKRSMDGTGRRAATVRFPSDLFSERAG